MYLEINISVVERGASTIPRNAPTGEDEVTPAGASDDTAGGAGCDAKIFLEAADAVLRTFPALIAISLSDLRRYDPFLVKYRLFFF